MLIRLTTPIFNDSGLDDRGHAVTRARVFGELATDTYPGQPWDRVEPQMAEAWGAIRGDSHLNWEDVRHEAHAAWQVAKLQAEGHMCDNAPVILKAA